MIMKRTNAALCTLLLATSLSHAAGDPARGEALKLECLDCHGENGMGNEEYPRIAGLDEDYLFEQLMAFKNGERPNRAELMLWFLEDLDEQDLADLAAYYASLDGE
jgi:cytochrome c553